jgi:hypothetical protein
MGNNYLVRIFCAASVTSELMMCEGDVKIVQGDSIFSQF